MEKLFRLSLLIVLFFTVVWGFAWLFNAVSYRLDRCLYYSVSVCACLFGFNLLFGFNKNK